MSKLFILELTEEEMETTLRFMNSGCVNINRDVSFEEKEKQSNICKSVTKKFIDSLKSKKDEVITFKDLQNIKCVASDQYLKLGATLQISNKKVDNKDFVHISLANALLMWLNSKNLLKRLARFDVTDDSYEYEEVE